ncbi:DNA excision repair protein ERCC-6-like [Harmonia axyridis]|uniref:DNA excision repair protein ERCC-6-like n=1 Tax=Harmonia axyridis TaxID=115357 RepID=UPI001E278F06|nr:DNA excision repair protein ERCC-6-like [Harmonia axyridis]
MSTEERQPLQRTEELLGSEGIFVWSALQESLENQALNELNEFVKETSKTVENNFEGNEPKSNDTTIIENYIRKQEELRKIQIETKKTKTAKFKQESSLQNNSYTRKKRKISDCKETRNKKARLPAGKDNIKQSTVENDSSCSEYIPSEEDSDYACDFDIRAHKSVKKHRNQQINKIEIIKDDGLLEDYNNRLDLYYEHLQKENELKSITNSEKILSDVKLECGLKVPERYWNKLYKYQQVGVKWLWSLHQKSSGGLLGDEMGLGKTVQIISFLYALDYSRIHTPFGNFVGKGPTIIVCPATVIHQWVQHFHQWAPEFRVAVLHQSGRFQGNKAVLIKDVNESNGILVTTYLGILKYKGNLVDHHWHYLVLDEGHKIRNATAKITVAVKQIKTPHRILLSGSPMQNNLQELWSLFDFTNPGVLGTLNTFTEYFSNPIIQGGFANASPMQEATALSVATALKNLISPFLLRRNKVEVQDDIELPNKSEQVLFCSLSDHQRMLYKDFLMSEHISDILGRGTKNWIGDKYARAKIFTAIVSLRKICNHPDIFIYDGEESSDETLIDKEENKIGFYKKSGKMIVVSALLKIWKKQKHRVLLFSQGRAMIKIFEQFLHEEDYKFLKMDGSTPISSRQKLINKFNEDETYDVFLLTTKVGGLGVNLTGANRVIIYDPDWNPATDTQARERAWRIGQNKQVTIYRLISAGTIEEKIYQRQIWKQLLSNKILVDPKTHRAFKSSDLFDLFSLQEPMGDSNPETTNIFHDSRVKIQERLLKKRKKEPLDMSNKIVFSEDKKEKMQLLAQQLAKNITKLEGNRTSYEKHLEEERSERLKKKKELQDFSAPELLELNRKKGEATVDDNTNKIDGSETSCSFSKALDIAETKAELLHKLIDGKLDIKVLEDKLNREKKEREKNASVIKKQKNEVEGRKKGEKKKLIIDESGKIDGETVEGLVKVEKKKLKRNDANRDIKEDDFILSKLFNKKGVSGALEHDSVMKGHVRKNNLRISMTANLEAEKAIQAITKSRLQKWQW